MTKLQKAWALEESVQGAEEENYGKAKQKAQYEENEIGIISDDVDMVVELDWVGTCTSTMCKEDEWVIDFGDPSMLLHIRYSFPPIQLTIMVKCKTKILLNQPQNAIFEWI